MTETVPDILARIVAHKRKELDAPKVPAAQLEMRATARLGSRRDFSSALLGRRPAIIGEIKKASPSRGVLAANYDPCGLASAYERGGAAALSVLTDQVFFQGNLDDLCAAREAVTLPVLRKDFTIDEYQVTEAAAGGADAILLIAAILDTNRLRELRLLAGHYKMAALVEVHDEAELELALGAGADIIGVNNRDLRTFQVSLETSLRLAAKIPAGVLKIAESGIRSAGDIRLLSGAGFQAFLVGEHLMQASDPAAALQALMSAS